MDINRPQTSDEEGASPPPLRARTPFRPLSRRRRQAMPPEPQSAVARPTAKSSFTASPNTIAAALAHEGSEPAETTLVWGEPGGCGKSADLSGK